MRYSIVPVTTEHWSAIRRIYLEGIATNNATFATEAPDWESWDASHRRDCRVVALQSIAGAAEAGEPIVLGWAALSPVSSRMVYAGVAEVSVYVAAAARGRGVGKALLRALIEESERNGIWTLQAGIFPENVASLKLHKSCGFRELGVRKKIGKMLDRWRDVLLLERRSEKTGV